jgi:pseudouridine kinase
VLHQALDQHKKTMLRTLVIGGQNIDIFAQATSEVVLHDSNAANIHLSFGGVACNIATNLALLGNDVSFLTVFGDDTFGTLAKSNLENLKIQFDRSLTVEAARNSMYLAVMNVDNNLFIGLNDMDIVNCLTVDFLKQKEDYIRDFDVLVIDTNVSTEVLKHLLLTYSDKQIVMDAVSSEKVLKLKGLLENVSLLKLNSLELSAFSDGETVQVRMDDVLSQGLKKILVTNEGNEILYQSADEHIRTMPIAVDTVVNTSGAGDAFLGGFIHGIVHHMSATESLEIAKKMAFNTLQSKNSININDPSIDKV